jgi:hypothetical protein
MAIRRRALTHVPNRHRDVPVPRKQHVDLPAITGTGKSQGFNDLSTADDWAATNLDKLVAKDNALTGRSNAAMRMINVGIGAQAHSVNSLAFSAARIRTASTLTRTRFPTLITGQ